MSRRTTSASVSQTLSTVSEVRTLLKRAAAPLLRSACLRALLSAVRSLQRLQSAADGGGAGFGAKGAGVAEALKGCDATAAATCGGKEDSSVRAAALDLLGRCARTTVWPPCLQLTMCTSLQAECQLINGLQGARHSTPTMLRSLGDVPLQACSVAEAGAPHLWERRAQKWHTAASTCCKVVLDAEAGMRVRQAAAHALAACVAAPWSGAAASFAAAATASSGSATATLQKAKDTAVDVYLLRPMHKAVAAEDRCAPAGVSAGASFMQPS